MHVLLTFSPNLWGICGEKNPVKLDHTSAECQSATAEMQFATAN